MISSTFSFGGMLDNISNTTGIFFEDRFWLPNSSLWIGSSSDSSRSHLVWAKKNSLVYLATGQQESLALIHEA